MRPVEEATANRQKKFLDVAAFSCYFSLAVGNAHLAAVSVMPAVQYLLLAAVPWAWVAPAWG